MREETNKDLMMNFTLFPSFCYCCFSAAGLLFNEGILGVFLELILTKARGVGGFGLPLESTSVLPEILSLGYFNTLHIV